MRTIPRQPFHGMACHAMPRREPEGSTASTHLIPRYGEREVFGEFRKAYPCCPEISTEGRVDVPRASREMDDLRPKLSIRAPPEKRCLAFFRMLLGKRNRRQSKLVQVRRSSPLLQVFVTELHTRPFRSGFAASVPLSPPCRKTGRSRLMCTQRITSRWSACST